MSDWGAVVSHLLSVISQFWPVIVLFVLVHAVWIKRHPTGWPRLAARYPAAPERGNRRRFFASGLVVGDRYYKNSTWLTIDDAYFHVSGFGPASLWLRRFSIPLAEIVATPDRYRWGPWDTRVIRLTFAREPSAPVMVSPGVFAKLAQASVGRLRLPAEGEPSAMPAASDRG
jgi:hypothetical protein